MTEKEQIIKDFLDDWYDMENFYEEHPELKKRNIQKHHHLSKRSTIE